MIFGPKTAEIGSSQKFSLGLPESSSRSVNICGDMLGVAGSEASSERKISSGF